MRSIYLDTCIAIYLVEEHLEYGQIIENILAQTACIVCFSALVELESLVLPLRLGRDDLVQKFQLFFAANQRLMIPDTVYYRAAKIRA